MRDSAAEKRKTAARKIREGQVIAQAWIPADAYARIKELSLATGTPIAKLMQKALLEIAS